MNDAMMAASLSTRLGEEGSARISMVPPIDPWPADWSPAANECHINAEAWVALHPAYSVVHGWLHIAGEPGYGASFEAHSVVRNPGGELRDVTKPRGAGHLFLIHIGPADEYRRNSRSGGPWVHLVEGVEPSLAQGLSMLQVRTLSSESIDSLPSLFPTD